MRDQLWAEAVHRFKSGETWHELPEEAREQQAGLYVEDIWAERVAGWLEGKARPDLYRTGVPKPIRQTTISELLTVVLDMDAKKQGRSEQTRMGQLLRRMGWRMDQKWVGGARIRVYLRPDPPESAPTDEGKQ